ncbi:LysR family transcriptional regulator [Eisenbergiella porci]|uniref:LysR family transcriptional regulator n=1 Tax=Eisenbergiella porci TaxID=2652274 RepID=UPI0038BC4F81
MLFKKLSHAESDEGQRNIALVTLLTVNELNSFTKAAQKLSLTQPAASQHVRQLEKELGVTIFVRGEGNLKLTSEGEIVIKYAKRIVSL